MKEVRSLLGERACKERTQVDRERVQGGILYGDIIYSVSC